MKFRFAKRICNWKILSINIPGKDCTVKKFLAALSLSITEWDIFINGLPTSSKDILKETDNIALIQKKIGI